MANPPPPYDNITGISRAVMKDNAQTTIVNYDGNARPGELVVNLSNNDLYIGNVNGGLTQLSFGAGTYGNSNVSTYLGTGQVGNIIPTGNGVYSLGNATNQWAELYVSNNSIVIGGVTLSVGANNTLSVNGDNLVTNTSLGIGAGGIMQGYSAIAIGTNAGNINQGLKAIAIGDMCGYQYQSANSIAIGAVSGSYSQQTEAVALGRDTGMQSQGTRSISVGTQAGSFYQSPYAIALGYQAGRYNQGANSVSIGSYAGFGDQSANITGQGNNSIVINATGANLTNNTANTFTVKPVRAVTSVTFAAPTAGSIPAGFSPMYYNPTTGEIIVITT